MIDPADRAERDRWLHAALRDFETGRDAALRDEILDRTNWIAVRCARSFADRGEPFDDLLQVARLGLIKALERFDTSQGVHFAGYAMPTIIGEIRRYFRDQTWGVHVARGIKDRRPNVNDAAEQLSKELGRAPVVDEIARRLDISPDLVVEALEANAAYRSVTLDRPGVTPPQVEGDFDHVLDRELVMSAMSRLRDRERKILYLRFFEELSQAEIADRVGTSQVHVGRLIASSLGQLRALLEAEPGVRQT